MRNYPDELAALEEEHASFKATTAREIEALKHHNAELEKRNAELVQKLADIENNKAKKDAEAWRKQCNDAFIPSTFEPPE